LEIAVPSTDAYSQVDRPLVELVNITKRFPGVVALDNVSFSVKKGEVHALLGENGAGKSTLIKLLTGVYPPDGGEIFLNGQKVAIEDPHHALRMGISAIYQDPILVPKLSVENNILLGREPNRNSFINQHRLGQQARQVLSELGLDVDVKQKVADLSPGKKQLVAIAKALSIEAQMLIMDEPTAALTDQEVGHLFQVIRKLRDQGISVIFVSHRMEEVFQIADRITILRDGKYIGTRNLSETSYAELVHMIVGRNIEIEILSRRPPRNDIALEVNSISSGRAFKNISFFIRQGEIVALAGLVGSGRTDVARAIFGASPVKSGQFKLFGEDYHPSTPYHAINHGIFMVPEDRKGQGIIPGLSVLVNISLANLKKYARLGFLNFKSERVAITGQIQQLRIVPNDPKRKVMNLSGGNQQKVVLAKSLNTQSRILILDEPTAGVDIGAKTEIRNLINQLADSGNAILLISSEIPEVLALADRVIVMKEGQIVGELGSAEANSERIIHLAMTGER
jgi:ribose transport system ATP-binding protein